MKKIAITLSFATLFTASFMSYADSERFTKLDQNDDGKVSVEEFTAKSKNKDKATKRFEKTDTNKDGYLSKEEVEQMPEKKEKNKNKNKEKS